MADNSNRFVLKRHAKKEGSNDNQPDYATIIKVGKVYYKITGWIRPASADLSLKMLRITPELLKSDAFLLKDWKEYCDTNNTKITLPKPKHFDRQ